VRHIHQPGGRDSVAPTVDSTFYCGHRTRQRLWLQCARWLFRFTRGIWLGNRCPAQATRDEQRKPRRIRYVATIRRGHASKGSGTRHAGLSVSHDGRLGMVGKDADQSIRLLHHSESISASTGLRCGAGAAEPDSISYAGNRSPLQRAGAGPAAMAFRGAESPPEALLLPRPRVLLESPG